MVQDRDQSLLDFLKRKSVAIPWQKINNQVFSYSGQLNAIKLSEIFQTPLKQIIIFFLDKGVIINQSQNLSLELVNLYCQSRKIKVAKQEKSFFSSVIEEYFNQVCSKENLVSRPPIISIMGHVNHGKTTLLDTIQGTRIQAQEKGGITQKINVCQIVFQGKKITLLDTPGHQIFFEMRRKGTSLTDLVVLVIDASEGVMPQTKEVIQHIQQNKIPTIVFLNHKNLSLANDENNLNRLKSQLQRQGLIPADIVSGNAKEKSSTDELLGTILLLAEENE
jgi:translation initiation factor IF-2